MLRYEYDDGGRTIVFVDPRQVVIISSAPAFEYSQPGKGFCRVTMTNNVSVIVPLYPNEFAAEVEEALVVKDDADEH